MTKIIFLILPDIHLLDLAGPDQAFLEAIGCGADLTVEYCSIQKSVSTSSNLNISRLKKFSKVKINKGDYVFIPGSQVKFLTARSIPFEKEVSKWLNEGYKNGANICSVCTGAFFLARTGLLNGRKCTTHWKRTSELKEKFPLISLVEDVLFTEDNRIYSSAGVTAGIDMALFIIGKIKDDSFSFQVARELVVYIRRQGNESQQSVFMKYRNHIHSGVHTVQDYLQENVAKKTSLNDLADIAFMSSRNLTRVFKKETGISVHAYINLIRKERIRELSKNPDNTRDLVALQCGLKSGRHVTRLLQTL
jgi:transcriptional regulator GlxA family with amidase domain